jgi:hypothetical protein
MSPKKYDIDLIVHTKPMHEKFIQLGSMFSREVATKGVVLYEKITAKVAENKLATDTRRLTQTQTLFYPATKIGGQALHKDWRASAGCVEVAERVERIKS